MMNKVEITKILVAIEVVIALVIINSVVPELRYDEKTEEEEL